MHVHANAAISVDGKLATHERYQIAISGPSDFERVDRLRSNVDAVLVGIGTVIADDPSLTVPSHISEDNPVRVVLDTTGRTPREARILDDRAETLIITGASLERARLDELREAGATVITVDSEGMIDLSVAIDALADYDIERLLVEGGGEVMYSFFEAEMVDELTLFISPRIIGGRDAPTLVDGEGFTDRFPELSLQAIEHLDKGIVCSYHVTGWQETPAGG